MRTIDMARLPHPFVSGHPEWIELHDYAWKTAAQHILTSRGRDHMDAAWNDGMNYQWVWDTCFITMYCRYAADQFPGIQSLDNFYELQRPDGFICMAYCMTDGKEPWPGHVNPPLFAWAEWEYYRSTGDASRFAHAIPHIEKLMGWIESNLRNQPHRRLRAKDGTCAGTGQSTDNYQLYCFHDCGSSGMDDSPRTPRLPEAGKYYDWIDLSSQMALSFRMLARMHRVVGNDKAATQWDKRAQEISALINEELWCQRTQFYHDRMIPTNFVPSKTAASFWPILAGICPPDRLDALIDHLNDPREFNRPIPVPSLSADDPNYSQEGVYWLGGVWAPTNYMITRGLMCADRGDTAHWIARRYIDGLVRTYKTFEPHTLWECQCPETDRPGLHAYWLTCCKPNFVGWSGVGPIAMLYENLLGLDADIPARRVTWTVRLTDEHGVNNFHMGVLGKADFKIEKRNSTDDPIRGTVRADQPLTLAIIAGNRQATISAKAGSIVAFTA